MAEIVKRVTDIDPTINFKFVRIFLADSEEAILTAKIKELGIEKQFQFIDWVTPEELICILQDASVGLSILMPYGQYHDRAIPTKLFEYMAAGLAIIAEESYYNRKFVKQNRCGYLESFDKTDRFSKTIIDLINNVEKLRFYGENGRRAFLEKYNWELYEQAFINYYNSL